MKAGSLPTYGVLGTRGVWAIHAPESIWGVGHPLAGRDYPRSVGELQAWFASDAGCLDYLEWLRWPEGFVCRECGGIGYWRGSVPAADDGEPSGEAHHVGDDAYKGLVSHHWSGAHDEAGNADVPGWINHGQ